MENKQLLNEQRFAENSVFQIYNLILFLDLSTQFNCHKIGFVQCFCGDVGIFGHDQIDFKMTRNDSK